ncbi:MAG: lysophospholipase [Deltaproteobacteria bacterium]|nr:lysophospholipase [Deltaproteobacteria bacterium]MBW2083852.1 lysophospholipase [Deltaproteobacteria bacterium]
MTNDTDEETGYFNASDGLRIFYRIYRSSHEVSRIAIVHGIGEHSGRYGNVVDTLLPKGISIWALDLRGHGKSEGKRGHIRSFDEYISDVLSLIHTIKEKKGDDTKCFLLGHSMGGLVAICFGLKYPDLIDGLIVSSPALGLAVEVPTVKRVLGNLMSRVFPSFTMANGLDVSMLSHDEQVVKAYIKDPLVHDRVSARWFTEILNAMEYVNSSVTKFKIPILMQIARDDHLTDPLVSEEFFERLTVRDKTLRVYEGLYHEIYNEKKDMRRKPLQDLRGWLEERR